MTSQFSDFSLVLASTLQTPHRLTHVPPLTDLSLNAIALANIPHILFVESPLAYTGSTVRRYGFPAGRELEHEFHSLLEWEVGT